MCVVIGALRVDALDREYAEPEHQRVALLLAERFFLVLVFQANIDVTDLAVDRADLVGRAVDLATLLVGVLQAFLVEVATNADVEATAAFTDLVGAVRNAESFQSLLA